jgi:pyridoxine 5-phosphate synthase
LREDRRHIQDRDVWKIREVVRTRLNLEMANTPEIVEIALRVKPDIVCLVPEKRREVTTEGGLDVAAHEAAVTKTCQRMNDAGIQVSLFIAPDEAQIAAAARTGSQFIELHTGAFAEHFSPTWRETVAFFAAGHRPADALTEAQKRDLRCATELTRLIAGAKLAKSLGLRVNAGHGLNYLNLPTLHQVPHLEELNIGHSIVSRAVTTGLAAAVKDMLALMAGYRG